MSNKEKPVSNKIKNTDEKMMKVVSHVLLIVLCVFCVGSFLLVLGSSFQSESEIQKIAYRMIPHEFSLEAYKAVFMSPGMILDSYMVTIITTVVGTIIGLCISASAGYVISRKNYRYRKILSFFIFFTMLFNGGLVPTYIDDTMVAFEKYYMGTYIAVGCKCVVHYIDERFLPRNTRFYNGGGSY